MKLSVVIPVYNEIDTIGQLLDKVKSVNIDKEVVIVDDCSKDGTREFLKNLKDKDIKVIYHDKNKGKGAAIRTAVKYTTGDVIIIQDADLEYDPNDYYNLIKPIEEGTAGVVYGSRIMGSNSMSYHTYYWGGRFLSWFTNILYKTNITDESTCYKVFRADIIKSIDLESNGFEFCPEITAKIIRRGYKICEVPISYYPRKFNEGKKINWIDGIIALWTLVKYRFKK